MPIPSQNKFILLISEAIAHHEGFYAQGSNPAKRNNNPGNLRGWDSSLPKDDKGFDEFPTRKAGFNALYRQVEKNIVERKLSLREFFAGKTGVYSGFAPASDNNNPINYANFVSQFLEDRGFYPISIDSGLQVWWETYVNMPEKGDTNNETDNPHHKNSWNPEVSFVKHSNWNTEGIRIKGRVMYYSNTLKMLHIATRDDEWVDV